MAALLQPAAGAASRPVGIDLLVTDARGQVITDLQPDEIDVREDGVPRQVAELRPAGAEPRTFAVFLDEYHVDSEATTRVRAAMDAFLTRELAPRDRVVVLRPLDSIVSVVFSEDRTAARAAAEAFEGRRGDFRPRTPFEANFVARSPAVVERTRTQVSWSAVAALADALRRVEGRRKTLVVVSEGIGSASAGRDVRMAGPETVARLANRGRVAVYALDPSAPPAGIPPEPQDEASCLTRIAVETNGRVVRGDVPGGLRAAAADAGTYYWLTYDPSHEDDGRFHRVTISITRAESTVRVRPGYWARSAVSDRIRSEGYAPPPSPLAETSHASPLITPWFGFSRGPAGTTRVTFVWEPSSQMIGTWPRRRVVASAASRLDVEVVASGDVPIWKGDLAPATPGQVATASRPSQAIFDVPPGRLRLRMSVRGGPAGEELDRDLRSLTVRAFDEAVTMGSVAVVRTFNGADWRRLVHDPGAAPSASREFRRTERLLLRFPVYAEGAVTAHARLLGPDGRFLRELVVDPGPGGDGQFQIDLPLASFAQGRYAVEIVSAARAGEARDLLPFTVTY